MHPAFPYYFRENNPAYAIDSSPLQSYSSDRTGFAQENTDGHRSGSCGKDYQLGIIAAGHDNLLAPVSQNVAEKHGCAALGTGAVCHLPC